MPTMIWTKVGPHADRVVEPAKAYTDDAGFDLAIVQGATIHPGDFVDLPTGVAVQLPPGYWGMLTGRSSALRTWGLLVNQGIIDNGYRGELKIGVQNVSADAVKLAAGTRIGQLIPMPMFNANERGSRWYTNQVQELGTTLRGIKGFGSTGRDGKAAPRTRLPEQPKKPGRAAPRSAPGVRVASDGR